MSYNQKKKTFLESITVSKLKQLLVHNGYNKRISGDFVSQKTYDLNTVNDHKEVLVSNRFKLKLESINFLKKIKNYRGLRHKYFLPVRGQRTHTNAKTCKKKKFG